jgi:hypothetical protein
MSGPGEDMTRQPSSASPDPHPWTWRQPSARVPAPAIDGHGRDHQALKGLDIDHPDANDRALKAAPPGGLRPALTAVPQPRPAPRTTRRARKSATRARTISKTDSATRRRP